MFTALPVTGNWVLTITDYCPPFSDCVSVQDPSFQFTPGITSWGLSIETPAVVPEPSTLPPAALALALLLLRIRYRGLVRGRR